MKDRILYILNKVHPSQLYQIKTLCFKSYKMIGFNWTCLVSSLCDLQQVNKSLRVISLSIDITDDSADLQRC